MGAITLPSSTPSKEEENIENVFRKFSSNLQEFKDENINGYKVFRHFMIFLCELKSNDSTRITIDPQLLNQRIIGILKNITEILKKRGFTPYTENHSEILPIIMMTYLRKNEFCDDNEMLDFAKNNEFIQLKINKIKSASDEQYSDDLEYYNQFYCGIGKSNIREMIDDIADAIKRNQPSYSSRSKVCDS